MDQINQAPLAEHNESMFLSTPDEALANKLPTEIEFSCSPGENEKSVNFKVSFSPVLNKELPTLDNFVFSVRAEAENQLPKGDREIESLLYDRNEKASHILWEYNLKIKAVLKNMPGEFKAFVGNSSL